MGVVTVDRSGRQRDIIYNHQQDYKKLRPKREHRCSSIDGYAYRSKMYICSIY